MIKRIYILHGWAYSTHKWEQFLSELKSHGFEPIMLKIPGLTAEIEKPWDINDYVTWLEKSLSKDKKVILLGHSNGGRIILAYCLKYPEKVTQAILLDSAGIYHNEFHLQLKRFVFGNIAKLKKILPSDDLKKVLYKTAREEDYYRASPIMKKTMANLIESDLSDKLENISIPTLIIWGENDTTTPLSDGRLIHKKIKISKLFIIKNARHSPMFTHAKEVGKIITEELVG